MPEALENIIPGGALTADKPLIQTPSDPPSAAPVVIDPPAATNQPDWRQPLVETLGKDYEADKVKSFLDRFDGVESLAKKALEQEKLIASGAHKKPQVPGKDASPEVLAAYREANGIPASPDAYDLTLDNGVVFGDEDASSLEFIKGVSHELGLNNDQVKEIASKWAEFKEAEIVHFHNQEKKQDSEFYAQQSAELRSLWGDDSAIEQNAALVKTLFDNIDGGVDAYEALISGRDGDGNLIANNAKILNALHQLAIRELPNHTIVESQGFSGKGINDRIEELKGMMNTPKWTNDRVEELAQLIAKRDKMPLK